MLLLPSKLFVAFWITLMSSIGVWLPVFFVRRSKGVQSPVGVTVVSRVRRASPSAASAATRFWLSLANCLSAGMLLTMAMSHFFPEAFEGEHGVAPSPPALCFWMLVGLLIPAVLERSMKRGGAHSHGLASDSENDHSHAGGGGSGGGAASTSTLLIILMCFHGMTEGLLLGFESKVGALLSAAVPLSVHKFCDGLVIGVAMAKEMYAQSEEDSGGADVDGDAGPRAGRSSSSRFWRQLFQGPIGVWLLLTPATMILVVLFGSGATSLEGLGTTSTEAPGVVTAVPSTANSRGGVSALAAVQAVGSGSFVYIGLTILSGEELKGASANAALLTGVAFTGALFQLTSGYH